MRDDLFAVPIRKYHIDNDADGFISFIESFYNENKFNMPSPYAQRIPQLPPWMVPVYSDLLENFIEDIKLSKTHVAVITSAVLNVLEKGESMNRCHTLPSHYTATHYVSENPEQSDLFYHPAKTLLEAFNPDSDEWATAAGLYINQGDVILHPSYIECSTPPQDKKRMTITLTVTLQRADERSRDTSN